MVFEVAGTMLGSLIQGLAITAFVGSANTCENGGVRTYDIRQERAYRYGSFTIAVITFICGLITFFGVKEQKGNQYSILSGTIVTRLPGNMALKE